MKTEITYEVTADDYYKFGKENAATQKEFHPTVITLSITFFLFIFADLIYSYFFGTLNTLNLNWLFINILMRIVLTFFLILLVFRIIQLMVSKKKKEILEMGKNAICCEHKLILTENELVEITDLFTNRSSWKAVSEIKESENYLFFGSSTAFTFIIPKRFFGERKQISDFVNTFNTYRQKSLNEYSPSYFAILDEKQKKNNEMN
jgi:hypothetical protein